MNAIRPPRHNLPPYTRRPNETAAEKISRLLAELAAAKRETGPQYWWSE